MSVGIEVGPTAVRAVRLQRTGGAISLLAAEELACDTSSPEALARALSQLRQALRIAQPVVLGVPETSAILTTVRPLVVNAKRALLAAQFELQQQLPFALNDAAWACHWLSPNGQTARTPNPEPRTPSHARYSSAVVAAMKRPLLEQRLAACRRAGVSVRAVAVNAVAILNAYHLQPSPAPAQGIALLQLFSDQAAEWLLWTPARLDVIAVSSPSPEAFRQELAASWQALQAERPELPASVAVIGSSAARAGVQELLTTALRLRLDAFTPSRVVATGSVNRELVERSAAAVGLAAQGLGLSRIPLNLLAGAQRDAASTSVRRAAAATAGVCALVALGLGMSGMLDIRQRRLRALEILTKRERLYQTLRPDVRALLQRQQRLDRISAQLERLIGEAPLVTQAFAEVADALPDQVWLAKVEYTKAGTSITGLLEGRAPSFQEVTHLLDQLKTLTGIVSVRPLSTNVMGDPLTGKELVTFTVQIERALQP